MQQYFLSSLLFIPLLSAAASLFIPSTSPAAFKRLSIFACVLQLIVLLLMMFHYDSDAGVQFVEQRSWITLDLGSWGILKADYFLGVDGLSFPLISLAVFILFIASISSLTIEKNVKGYSILFLIMNAAILGSFMALDFLLFYLFFEFMLLPMFFLIGIWGGTKREYASIKFFLYTLLGSILILIVMIGLYLSNHDPSFSGKLVHSFNMLQMRNPSNVISNSILDINSPWMIAGVSARSWAFLLLFIGFAIKLPAVPLHTWLPDAHVEAPTPVSVLLAALLLKIGGYGLLRIAYPIFPDAALDFSWFVALIGVISIIWGALAAMASKDLKRLIAYSSVSHMGFVLLGISSVTTEGVTGAVYQMVSHGVISAMLFLLAGVLYDRTHDRTISNYSGLANKVPMFFTFVLIAFFASLGLPGFSGFIGELMVFLGAFKSNQTNGLIHESFAIIATLGLLFGAAYFLWTIQRMFFGIFHLKGEREVQVLTDLDTREKSMLIPLAVVTVVFGIFPQPLMDVINPFAQSFVDLVTTSGSVDIPR
jgi:NADH-quinone oxidoreductase subunit M